jgi:hypothetical protein
MSEFILSTGWLPDAEQMLTAARAMRAVGAILLHVAGIIVVLL